jgi:hypothetical protein
MDFSRAAVLPIVFTMNPNITSVTSEHSFPDITSKVAQSSQDGMISMQPLAYCHAPAPNLLQPQCSF